LGSVVAVGAGGVVAVAVAVPARSLPLALPTALISVPQAPQTTQTRISPRTAEATLWLAIHVRARALLG
jgi:hypothetical protein